MSYCNTILQPYSNVVQNKSLKPQNKKQVSFTSKPLLNTNIKKLNANGEYDLVPAVFSRLSTKDSVDIQAMTEVAGKWEDTKYNIGKSFLDTVFNSKNLENTKYDTGIPLLNAIRFKFDKMKDNIQSGVGPDKYYGIELKDNSKPHYERLLCLVRIHKKKDYELGGVKLYNIDLLQASPEVLKTTTNGDRQIKGAGETCIYGIIKLAEKYGLNGVRVKSTNNSLYEKLPGFRQIKIDKESKELKDFLLIYEDYNKFLSSVKQKYSVKT